ncbi:cell-envelope stress modulator CpxP [Candidatus Pantoea soli]|uniref:Stress adaptor protein CpxP n=1 Tax=Candidatus Pantoea soli TaxID=3098669 RepID=A0A518XH78_9GAMM|nr:cell-envelope stress modulator CpxP [Pantoea soli]QDY43446.1 stress adaptor protein CpxP [Pantoea soli]
MRYLTAVVIASAMVLSQASAEAADTTTIDEMHQNGGLTSGSMTQNPQSHMFDGIELTEQQRQQMRDLMQQARHERPVVSVQDIETLHDLETADQFNENAVRQQAEKQAKAQVELQVEMARVRNQMYHLLSPSQQATLQKNFERRLKEARRVAGLQPSSPLHAVSSTSSNQ